MILLKRRKGGLTFELGEGEKSLMISILGLYPRVTSAASLSHGPGWTKKMEETQALLEEALKDQRAENKKNLQAFLAEPRRFEKQGADWHFSLSEVEADWLLQILNDVRVGSWMALGCPEPDRGVVTQKSARDYWAMEIAGRFEAVLLEALSGGSHG